MTIKKRSIPLYLLLSIVTLGIYPIVLMCIMGSEVNEICKDDGKNNMFYLLALLLGIVTLGIYPVIWFYKAMNRLQDNAYRYGPTVRPAHSGSEFLLWFFLGAFIAVGPVVAVCYFISDVNAFADIAGYVTPLPYTDNKVERLSLAENAKFAPNTNPIGGSGVSNPALGAGAQAQLPAQNQQSFAPPSNNQPVDNVPPTTGIAKQREGAITCISGMYSGFSFPIRDGEEIIIGSDPKSCSIVIDVNSSYISGKHCIIKFIGSNNTYMVVDTSTNGTFKENDVKLNKDMPEYVSPGEMIYLATRDNSFRLG